MIIHLPKDIESSIQAAVHGGHYASVDEAMTQAASLLLERLNQTTTTGHGNASQADRPIWEIIEEENHLIPRAV